MDSLPASSYLFSLHEEAADLREAINNLFMVFLRLESTTDQREDERQQAIKVTWAFQRARAMFLLTLHFYYNHINPCVLDDAEILAAVRELNCIECDGVYNALVERIAGNSSALPETKKELP